MCAVTLIRFGARNTSERLRRFVLNFRASLGLTRKNNVGLDFQIVQTHPSMLTFVDSLQKKNAEQLSFYPKQVFERELKQGRLFLGLLNGDPCGYIYVGASGRDVKCHQVCIEYDARRALYGSQLVAAMENYAAGARAISLRCGFDLDANEFWAAHGYQCVKVLDGGIRRKRRINVWLKQPGDDLFGYETVAHERGKTSSTIWRKNKTTGVVSQFTRGKALKDYRTLLISEEKS